jgi:hypothetical protein
LSYIKSSAQLAKSNKGQIQNQAVLLSNNIQSPLSFGFPKAKIYLPFDIEKRWTPREIEMCLIHEKIHIEQNDVIWKLLSLIIRSLLFFAPWAYFLHKKFELETEIFCDTRTCELTNADIQEYGNLLLNMNLIQTNNFIFTNIKTSTLKRRILAMKSKSKHRPMLVSALSAILVFTGGTAVATTNEISLNKNIYKITSKIFIDDSLVSTPQIVAHANQKAAITLGNTDNNQFLKIGLIAKDIAKNNIKLNYDIQYANGNTKIHTKPEMVLALNHEGVIKIASDTGHTYEMKVMVSRVN